MGKRGATHGTDFSGDPHFAPSFSQTLAFVLLFLVALSTAGQVPSHPLQPPDRSSPRATLRTFLTSSDAAAAFFVREYRPSPTRQSYRRLFALCDSPLQCLDLSEVPPASRLKTGGAAAMALYETLSRIELPGFEQVPGSGESGPSVTTNVSRWVIPHTEIALVRIASGPRTGDYLFSSDTVARAAEFYQRVRELPYNRSVPAQNLYERRMTAGGWLIPLSWVEAMPSWMRDSLGGQALWKWIALILVIGCFVVLLRIAYRLSLRGGERRPFLRALAGLSLPLFVLAVTPVVAHFVLVQINLVGGAGSAAQLIASAVMFLSGAWLAWRAAPVVAEAIIASPQIAPESIDAHLIRICSRLLGLLAAAGLLAIGADRVGIPVYGIIAGLGVGGLAIALAAQPTIENLIGSLNLFADKPIRVGSFCRYGESLGTVESIGIRSTRIRGVDRTLTTIPNATLSKMPIVNFTQRDRMLLKAVIAVRWETTAEQLRFLLTKLREMLLSHPRILPESARARLVGLGAGSREVEVFAHVRTQDWPEFLGIQEDVFLRIIDIVQQSGTGFALPSQSLYFGPDIGLDIHQKEAAEANVRRWREENRLPFPDFPAEQIKTMQGTLAFPPEGSPARERGLRPEDSLSSGEPSRQGRGNGQKTESSAEKHL